MRLYVIGGQGQVARSLREAAAGDNDIVFGCAQRPDIDLLRPASIAQALADFRPDIVVNPAAYTAVDKAESEPDQAFALNRDGARTVAAAAANQGTPVIHFSRIMFSMEPKMLPMSKATPSIHEAFMDNPSLRENWPSPQQTPGISF